ncbi:MAG: hypothetical protein IT285_13120 [Bdellovibrionales bacterium]|nr:hypothetical protein [Bdellovibrionales bacterium]
MSRSIRTAPVSLFLLDEPDQRPTNGTIRIQDWNRRARILRAIRLGAGCWGLGLAAVLLPLLHFILVPALLLAGPIVALLASRQDSVLLGGEGICPKCGAPVKIERAAPRFPLKDLCTACQRALRIELLRA